MAAFSIGSNLTYLLVLISSAVFAGLTTAIDRQTAVPAALTPSVTIGHIYVVL